MRGLLWVCLPLLAAWPARTQHAGPSGCAGVTCDPGQECRLRHTCDAATSLPNSYLPPCRERAECVPTVTCAGHRCQPGHHCRLQTDPAPAAGQYRPALQRAVCQKTASCDELRCTAGERCGQRQACEYSLKGYLPPCETLYECRSEMGSGVEEKRRGAEKTRGGVEQTRSGAEETRSSVEETRSGAEETRRGAEKKRSGVEQTRSGAEETKSSVKETSSGAEETRRGAQKATSGAQKKRIGVEETRSGAQKTSSGVEEPRSGTAETRRGTEETRGTETRSGGDAYTSRGETAEKAEPSPTGKTVTEPVEKGQSAASLPQVIPTSAISAIVTDAQTAQSDQERSQKLPTLGELDKVFLDDAEFGSVISAFSNSFGSAGQPIDEESQALPTADYQAPQSVTRIEPNSAPKLVINVSDEPALIQATIPSPKTASSKSVSTSPEDQLPESDLGSESVPAPELNLDTESFADIIVLTPESLRTSELAEAAAESLLARRSVGTRSCADTQCAAGQRCVLQDSRPICRRLTCKDVTCKSGTRCLILGGVPVCRPPPSPRTPAPANTGPGTATSCDAIQCADNQKCVLAGGKAWCAHRRTCASLRCRYDQHCQVRRGLPRCAIRRSCDGVSCATGKVCQLIGRLPRCVIAPQCADLRCGPSERCVSVGGTPTCLAAPACYDRRCPPRQECRVVGDEHACVDTPTCDELRCGRGRVCREFFGAAKCITATTCANAHCRHDQKCEVRDNLARCVSLKGALCSAGGGCAPGLECRPVAGTPTCVKPATCWGVSCLSGQRCAVLSGTPTCVASCAAADCASELFCRVKADRAVCVECELDCPTGQECKLRDPREITSEYVVYTKKIPHCVTEEP